MAKMNHYHTPFFREVLLDWMARKSTPVKLFTLADLAALTGYKQKRIVLFMTGVSHPTPRELDVIATAFAVSQEEFFAGHEELAGPKEKAAGPVVTLRIRDLLCRTCRRKIEDKCGFCRLKEAFDLAERVHEGMDPIAAIGEAEKRYYRELDEMNEAFDRNDRS
jgi:transcriptional regulator with XRE-family HTH domain